MPLQGKLSHLQSLVVRLIKVRSHANHCKPTPEHRRQTPAGVSSLRPSIPAKRRLLLTDGLEKPNDHPTQTTSGDNNTISNCSDDIADSDMNSEG